MADPPPGLPRLRLSDAPHVARIVGGRLDPDRLTLFSLFRDEAFFAPAFFSHYRALGVQQFVILDDDSTDGTRAFLASQPDCVLLASDLTYGQEIAYVDPEGRASTQRAGVYFKMALPRAFRGGDYVTYVDADEFLFLPPGARGLPEVINRLRAERHACCVASIVEFFPETIAGLRTGAAPGSLPALVDACGWFQPEPMVEIDAAGVPQAVGRSKSARLFEQYGIALPARGLRKRAIALFRPQFRRSPQFKTPIFRCDDDTVLTGTHLCNKPAPRDLMLTIGHFVFTTQFEAKVARALEWRSHVRGADKYEHYARLLARIDAGDGRLTDPASARFTSIDQFVHADLMQW